MFMQNINLEETTLFKDADPSVWTLSFATTYTHEQHKCTCSLFRTQTHTLFFLTSLDFSHAHVKIARCRTLALIGSWESSSVTQFWKKEKKERLIPGIMTMRYARELK